MPTTNTTALEALKKIADPISYFQSQVQPGGTLNGIMAVSLSNDPEWLKGVARDAIAALESSAPSEAEPAFWGCFVGDELVKISKAKDLVESHASRIRGTFTSGDSACTAKPIYLAAPPAPAPSAAEPATLTIAEVLAEFDRRAAPGFGFYEPEEPAQIIRAMLADRAKHPAPAPSAASEREALTDELNEVVSWAEKMGAIGHPDRAAAAIRDLAQQRLQTPDEVAHGLAAMVTEWVDTGIKMGTDWRPGLAGVIASRLSRAALHSTEKPDREVAAQPWIDQFYRQRGFYPSLVQCFNAGRAAPADAPVAEPVAPSLLQGQAYAALDQMEQHSGAFAAANRGRLGIVRAALAANIEAGLSAVTRARPPAPEDAKDAAREPLTRTQIDDLAEKNGDFDTGTMCYSFNGDPDCRYTIYNFVRDIEAAHGITDAALSQGDGA